MSQDTKFELVLSKHNVSDEMKAKLRESFSSYEAIALEWNDKIDSIVIESEEQVSEMKKAREARLFIRDKRLAVTNAIKEQKEESLRKGQALDAIKRFFLELFEPLEEKAELKEKYAQIKQEERRKAKAQERVEMVKPYDATIHESTVIDMTVDVFGSYLLGVKKTYEERIEAERVAEEKRIEAEKIEQLRWKRSDEIKPYYDFFNDNGDIKLGAMTESEYDALLTSLKNAKAERDAQIEAQRAENERLKREAEEKEQRRADRAKLLSPYIVFIRDYNGLLDKDDSEFNAEFQNIKIGAEQQWEYEREEAAKAKREQEKAEQHRANLEAELKAKQEAEAKAEQERLAALEAELSKGDAEKFDTLISDLTVLKTKYQFKSAKYRKKSADVSELIDRIITHVKK